MRAALTLAVLLAVVSVAMVAVCEFSEVRRLRYRLWESERRRDSLARQLRELDAAIGARNTPRSLFEEDKRRREQGVPPAHYEIVPPKSADADPVILEINGRRMHPEGSHRGGPR